MTTVNQLIEEYRVKYQTANVEKDYMRVATLTREYSLRVKALPNPEDEIAASLEDIARNKLNLKSDGVTNWIIAAQVHPSTKYLESLHTMIVREEQFIWHEGIVDILYTLRDERSIPSLVKALEYDNSYYDPSRELANKILDTLIHIGTPEAQAVVRGCLKSPIPQIRKRAHLLLKES